MVFGMADTRKRLVLKNQDGSLFRRQAVLDERQIHILVAAIKFVADDRMADVREMDADLVFATGMRAQAQKREWKIEDGGWIGSSSFSFFVLGVWKSRTRMRRRTIKSAPDPKFRLRRRAIGADAIFDGDDAAFIPAERRVNRPLLYRDMAVNNGQIFFLNGAAFDDFSELAGGFGIFCNQDNAAGFAVEPVDQMGLRAEG
jgi:hypothetical protein